MITMAPKAQTTWLQHPVQHFFRTCNWDNEPIADLASQPSDASIALELSALINEPVRLTWSVQRFIATINWDGAVAQMLPAVTLSNSESDSEEKSGFTLNDFGDLF